MPTSLTSFANSEFRMRFREQYVTEGLNAKLAVNTPPGTYRGFHLATHGSNDTVTVEADASALDHVAVYQTDDAFSLTVRKSGGDYALDLASLVDVAQKTWVICIYADYAVGSTTTAEHRAYELLPTDEYTTAPEKDELVVLGTVTIGAGGGIPIPAGQISSDNRTPAWAAQAPEALTAVPVTRNGNFELGRVGSNLSGAELPFWEIPNPMDSGVDGVMRLDDSDPYSGFLALGLTYVAAGTCTTDIVQRLNVSVYERLYHYRIRFKPVQVATAGSATLIFRWRDSSGGSVGSSFVSLDLTTAGSYITIQGEGRGSATTPILHRVELALNGLTFASSGLALLIDEVQVWVEGGSAREQFLTRSKTQEVVDSLVLAQEISTSSAGVLIRSDETSPSGEGSVLVERRDQNSALKSPVLDHRGRLINVGDSALGSVADARLPRISGGAILSDYTLIEEWGTSLDQKYRVYVHEAFANNVEVWKTRNCFWNGTAWESDYSGDAIADVTGTNHYRYIQSPTAGGQTWTDWDRREWRRYGGDTGYTERFRIGDFDYGPLVLPGPAGHIGYRGVWFYDEFPYKSGSLASAAHDVWDSFASGSGTVTSAYGGYTNVKLTSTAGSGYLYTYAAQCSLDQNPSFSAVVQFPNLTGHAFVGFGNTQKNFGFHIDPVGYGNSNMHFRIYDSTSTAQYQNSGWAPLTSLFYVLTVQARSLDSAGNSRIYWRVMSENTFNGAVLSNWSPGVAVLSPTIARNIGFFTEGGQEMIIKRVSVYSTPS